MVLSCHRNMLYWNLITNLSNAMRAGAPRHFVQPVISTLSVSLSLTSACRPAEMRIHASWLQTECLI